MEKKMENDMETGCIMGILGLNWGYTGIMENIMEATIVFMGHIGIMENIMEATIQWKLL